MLLFGLPGLIWSALAALSVFGVMAGGFWLFIFGDEPWPESAAPLLVGSSLITFLLCLTLLLSVGYATGKKYEAGEANTISHCIISLLLTLLPLGLLGLHSLFRAGSTGANGSVLCRDYCMAQGYRASGLDPQIQPLRQCRCFDEQGKVQRQIDFHELRP